MIDILASGAGLSRPALAHRLRRESTMTDVLPASRRLPARAGEAG
ncbi:hypothetical protein [[Actinomadura] parvosata]|nr:hypothetical protein [Nonomuraea sp. ATCC 55076]